MDICNTHSFKLITTKHSTTCTRHHRSTRNSCLQQHHITAEGIAAAQGGAKPPSICRASFCLAPKAKHMPTWCGCSEGNTTHTHQGVTQPEHQQPYDDCSRWEGSAAASQAQNSSAHGCCKHRPVAAERIAPLPSTTDADHTRFHAGQNDTHTKISQSISHNPGAKNQAAAGAHRCPHSSTGSTAIGDTWRPMQHHSWGNA